MFQRILIFVMTSSRRPSLASLVSDGSMDASSSGTDVHRGAGVPVTAASRSILSPSARTRICDTAVSVYPPSERLIFLIEA